MIIIPNVIIYKLGKNGIIITENEKEKCLIYKNYQCMKCKIGYKLLDRKCFLNHSFRGLYYSSIKNENIKFINEKYEKFIENIIIDNKKKPVSVNYFFPVPGLHEVFVSLNIEKMNSTEYMFYGISNLISLDITKNFLNENLESMKEMFMDCVNLKAINFDEQIYTNIVDLSHMFGNCISLISLKLPIYRSQKLENISYMFAKCISLKSISIPYINTINIRDMSGLFYGCSSLTSIDLSEFKTSNIINIRYIFSGCSSLTSVNIEFFDLSKIDDVKYMFSDCLNLKSVKLPYLNEIQMKNINKMFIGCKSLSSENIFFQNPIKINDICIVGLWYGSNYGSMLTYYALHQVIKKMNYSILMINNPQGNDKITLPFEKFRNQILSMVWHL